MKPCRLYCFFLFAYLKNGAHLNDKFRKWVFETFFMKREATTNDLNQPGTNLNPPETHQDSGIIQPVSCKNWPFYSIIHSSLWILEICLH